MFVKFGLQQAIDKNYQTDSHIFEFFFARAFLLNPSRPRGRMLHESIQKYCRKRYDACGEPFYFS